MLTRRAVVGAGLLLPSPSFARRFRGSVAPAPRLVPTSNRTSLLGDSITQSSTEVTPTNATYATMDGYLAWLQSAQSYRTILQPGNNFGIGGQNTTQMLARIDTVIAGTGTTCVFNAGINDLGAGIQAPQTISNYQAIITALANAGILVVLCNNLPDETRTAPSQQANLLTLVAWLSDPQRSVDFPNVLQVDTWTPMHDPLTVCGYKAGYTVDGKHPSPLGYSVMGRTIGIAMEAMYPGQNYPSLVNCPVSASDSYNAITNPTGCLNPNFMLTGSGGSFLGSNPPTGACPDQWFVSSSVAGITINCSKGFDPDGFGQLVMAVSGTPGGTVGTTQSFSVRSTSNSTVVGNINAGDVMAGQARSIIDPGAVGLYGFATGMSLSGINGGGTVTNTGYTFEGFPLANGSTTGQVYFGDGFDAQLLGQQVTAPADWATQTSRVAQFNNHYNMYAGVPVSFTTRLSRCADRKMV